MGKIKQGDSNFENDANILTYMYWHHKVDSDLFGVYV